MIPVSVRPILEDGGKGKPAITIGNFLLVMTSDKYFNSIRYNELSGNAEIHTVKDGNVKIEKWTDTDEAKSRNYIESNYKLYSKDKHSDALRMLFELRKYNPIIDIIEGVKWDGVERCERFLIDWAKVEDSPYSREVSRLIFAGGIHRLYQPGTKFDDVPILIGTKQGEGKSTLVRFLAISDEYYGEVTQMEGTPAIEQLQGKWICEISELLALTKTKEQEAAKAYITRAFDKYRKPWDKNTVDLPRRCIFIGTSNNSNPLSDKSGNRRYYPIEVHSDGYEIFDHEDEIRDYVLQCWAEAREKYKAGKMPNYANKSLQSEYRKRQEEAMQDDWRIGAIEQFLGKKYPGEFTCVREICHEALSSDPDRPHEPSLVESKDIGMIMNKMPGWERRTPRTVGSYGRQRCWQKVKEEDEPPKQKPTTNPAPAKQVDYSAFFEDDDADDPFGSLPL